MIVLQLAGVLTRRLLAPSGSPTLRLLLANLSVSESGEDQAAVAEYLFGPERRRGLTGAFFMAASCPNPRRVAEIPTGVDSVSRRTTAFDERGLLKWQNNAGSYVQ